MPPVTLAQRTTLRVGGPAQAWIRADSAAEMVDAVLAADRAGTPLLLLGDGSNVVCSDEGFAGAVLEVRSRGIAEEAAHGRVRLVVEAGEPWDGVVALAASRGWSGIEALSGIPGRCGATPIQNVGAYGQELAQVVAWVRALDRSTGQVEVLAPSDCGFEYRSSAFKAEPGRWVVLSLALDLAIDRYGAVRYPELAATVGVATGGRADVEEIRAAVLLLRRSKGMVLDEADHDTWSAGSFFTNPVVADPAGFPDACPRYPARSGSKLSAAWLIEQSGMPRGFALPGSRAAISGKHTLALTNRGGASAGEVLALAREVQRRVREAFAVDLVIEPVLVGA
ncbi:MAG: UDP-N-acetylmuramate dehydrogenase [Candidatus Nanopelagicales bacterium]